MDARRANSKVTNELTLEPFDGERKHRFQNPHKRIYEKESVLPEKAEICGVSVASKEATFAPNL